MKHRIARNKAISKAIRSKSWELGRDPALLAKMEAWLEFSIGRAETATGRELTIEEALDCIAAGTFADFDRDDKEPLAKVAWELDKENQRLRGLLELAKT